MYMYIHTYTFMQSWSSWLIQLRETCHTDCPNSDSVSCNLSHWWYCSWITWMMCNFFQPQDVSSLAILPSQSQKQWKHIRFVASCTSWWLVDGYGHPASRNVWSSTLEIKSNHTDLLPGHELHLWPWKHDSIEFEVWSSQTNQTPSSCGASIKNRSCCTHSC